MRRIGLLGCGNIGEVVARRAENVEIVAAYDQIPERVDEIARLSGAAPCRSFDELLSHACDTVIEAASIEAVKTHAEDALAAVRHLVVLSVGALMDEALRQRLETVATRENVRVYVPSGAVIGLDNLKIARSSRIDRLLLRTTKPPAALGVESQERTCLFRGPASECIARFPKNINVSASVSLAAGRECDVEIWVDPAVSRNCHEIFVEGEFGSAEIAVQNLPSPDNPRTSYLAALSVCSLLANIDDRIVIGG